MKLACKENDKTIELYIGLCFEHKAFKNHVLKCLLSCVIGRTLPLYFLYYGVQMHNKILSLLRLSLIVT